MSTKIWKSFIVPLVIVIALIPLSCKVTEKSYRKVATDTKVTSEKKAIIAPWVSVYFPIQETVIPGKTVVSIDTVHADGKTDTITGVVHHYDTVRVSRTVVRTDTIRAESRKSAVIISVLQKENAEQSASIIRQASLRETAENNLKEAKGEKMSLIWWIVGLGVALLISIYFHIRRII